MSTKLLRMSCPEYNFNNKLDYKKVSEKIDKILIDNFSNQNVILRGIQSEKHHIPKDKLVQHILDTGSDRYELASLNASNANDKYIDLFGYACTIKSPIVMPVLEGFHRWKPKCLEHPQYKIDIWMFYDPEQLENVEYMHSRYHVKTNDGYIFKNRTNAQKALLGVLVID